MLPRPLRGLKVIEASTLVAGPALGSLLSTLGATVIKIEQPKIGDPSRQVSPWGFANYNYGKKSVCLNLKSAEGKKILWKLISTADLFIENLGPDVPERLGFSFPHLRRLNQKLVYCSIKGFARGTKDYYKPAFDAIAQALSGTMSLTGEPDGEPLRVGNPSVDLGAAAYGAIEILAALLESRSTGVGRFVEISLLDMSVYWNGYWLTYYGISGNVPQRLGSGHFGYCPHRVFKTRDSQFIFIATLNDSQWKKLDEVLRLNLPRSYDQMSFRLKHRHQVEERISKRIGMLDAQEAIRRISSQTPCAKVNTIRDVYRNRELSTRNVLALTNYNGKKVKIVTPPTVQHQSLRKGRANRVAAVPNLGADTHKTLRELGYDEESIRYLESRQII
ncbi:MAG: CoA transferase [Nitrososphaerota archaeon]|nr:CoA transferase [Nitrososphaerota archaeon]